MARNGSGTYSLPSGQPVVTGTTISSTTFNTLTADIATALTQSIAADGQTPVTANIPMNSKKITGLAAGTTSGDALSYGQALNGTTGTFSGALTGTTGAFTGALSSVGYTFTGSTSGTLSMSATGVPYGSALHNNAGAVTGATNQYMCSGTYTPTGFGVGSGNVQALTPNKSQWLRVGNVVTVSGSASVDPTSANVQTFFSLSLPIASNLANLNDLSGVCSFVDVSDVTRAGTIRSDIVNDRAQLSSTATTDTAPNTWNFVFTYEVL